MQRGSERHRRPKNEKDRWRNTNNREWNKIFGSSPRKFPGFAKPCKNPTNFKYDIMEGRKTTDETNHHQAINILDKDYTTPCDITIYTDGSAKEGEL